MVKGWFFTFWVAMCMGTCFFELLFMEKTLVSSVSLMSSRALIVEILESPFLESK